MDKPTLQSLRNFALQQSAKDRITRACAYCEKVTEMRSDQSYCSAKCRKAAHDLKKNAELILLREEVERLQNENATLKTELEKLNAKA